MAEPTELDALRAELDAVKLERTEKQRLYAEARRELADAKAKAKDAEVDKAERVRLAAELEATTADLDRERTQQAQRTEAARRLQCAAMIRYAAHLPWCEPKKIKAGILSLCSCGLEKAALDSGVQVAELENVAHYMAELEPLRRSGRGILTYPTTAELEGGK